MNDIVLTGITTTGMPHLGNYVGAIKPSIEASEKSDVESFFLIADYHSLMKNHKQHELNEYVRRYYYKPMNENDYHSQLD